MKPSDSKGFWGTVAATQLQSNDISKSNSAATLPQSQLLPPELLEQFRAVVATLRHIRLGITTKSGRRSTAPKWYAISACVDPECGGAQVVQSGRAVGQRWSCVTCNGLSLCAWTDGVAPDEEAIREEFAAWQAKQEGKRKT